MPPTVDGFLLLGWMEKDEAVRWLTKECQFEDPLSENEAVKKWLQYRDAVAALPERSPEPPKRESIPSSLKSITAGFLTKLRGPEVLDVLNIHPMDLRVYQLYVVADRANHHAKQLGGKEWAHCCLPVERPTTQMPVRSENGTIKVNIPHAEHLFTLGPQGFVIQQGGGFVSVCDLQGRMLLKAGYHRSFAFCRSLKKEPEAKEKSLLVALTNSLPLQLSPDFPMQGLRTMVLGSRPPLLSDFLDESLAMPVKLRKKRYEMHINVQVVPIDET